MSRRGLEVWRVDGDPTPLACNNTFITNIPFPFLGTDSMSRFPGSRDCWISFFYNFSIWNWFFNQRLNLYWFERKDPQDLRKGSDCLLQKSIYTGFITFNEQCSAEQLVCLRSKCPTHQLLFSTGLLFFSEWLLFLLFSAHMGLTLIFYWSVRGGENWK